MRIGVFGGTFDPPHLAHAMACLWALESGEVDRVMLVPVAHHPYGKAPGASFAQRMEMCRLAVERLGEAVEVSPIEDRPGLSYMVDTLRLLRAAHPHATFRLMVGSDVVGDVANWREGSEVLSMAEPLHLPRPRAGVALEDQPGVLPPISSTTVRSLLARGDDVRHLLGHEVLMYIQELGLYSGAAR